MYLSTFLSTLIFSSETAFTANVHTKAHVTSKKGIGMEKYEIKLFKSCVRKKVPLCEQKFPCI